MHGKFLGWWKGRLTSLWTKISTSKLEGGHKNLDSRLQQKVFVKLETNWKDFSDKSLRKSACDTWNLPTMLNRDQQTSRDFAPPFGVSQCMALCSVLRHVQEGQGWWEKETYLHFDYFWGLDWIVIFFYLALKCTFLPIERGTWGFPMKVFSGWSQLRQWMISEVSGWSVAWY